MTLTAPVLLFRRILTPRALNGCTDYQGPSVHEKLLACGTYMAIPSEIRRSKKRSYERAIEFYFR
jgi:hypothetical protein